VILEIVSPDLCPRYLAAGSPFFALLGGFAWLFERPSETAWPQALEPENRLPPEVSPGRIAAALVSQRRLAVVIGGFVGAFELDGPPDDGLVSLSLVVAGGTTLDAVSIWAVRWGMLQQAVCGVAGAKIGRLRLFLLYPSMPESLVETIVADSVSRSHERQGEDASMSITVPVVSGCAGELWLSECQMFLAEHCQALGYQDRFIATVLAPAMSAYLAWVAPDVSDDTRRSLALVRLKSVRDSVWRDALTRYVSAAR